MTRTPASLIAALLLGCLPACYATDHFPGDASRYDGLFFGPCDAPQPPTVRDSRWRNYALFGLVAWDGAQTRFAGEHLATIDPRTRPMRIVVETKLSLVNGLAAGGLAFVGGILQPLLFVPRTTEVEARPSQ